MNRKTRLGAALSSALVLAIPLSIAASTTACMPGVAKHDKLTATYVECDEAWANLEAQYQRRADLLPQAAKIVKARAASEKDILTGIVEARAAATSVTIDAKALESEETMAKFQANQTQVAQSFGRLMEIHEKYPELKSDEGFQSLMTQVEGTENRILIARKKYNAAVKAYNFQVLNSGGKVFNAITGEMFAARVSFKAQAGAEKAPELDL
jgi:LemA protein